MTECAKTWRKSGVMSAKKPAGFRVQVVEQPVVEAHLGDYGVTTAKQKDEGDLQSLSVPEETHQAESGDD